MSARWIICAVFVAGLLALGDKPLRADLTASTFATGASASPIVVSMIDVVQASRHMTTRVKSLEEKRARQVAAHPTAPVYLNIAGVQNLRPLDTFYSSGQVR